MRTRHTIPYPPYPPYPYPVSRRRPAGGVPRGVWLFLLCFVLASFLFVFLWPHRVLILHILIDVGIGLLLVLCLTALLVIVWKLRKPIRAWRARRPPRAKQPPRPLLLVRDAPHDAPHDEFSARRLPSSPSGLLYDYDYQTNQRPSEHLNPGQSSRF